MKSLLATIIGLAMAVFANPATAYVVEITTSIPVTSVGDDTQLRHAVESAIDDVLKPRDRVRPDRREGAERANLRGPDLHLAADRG